MTSTPDRRVGRTALAALALAALSLPVAAAPGSDALNAAIEALGRRDGIAAEVELRRALDAGVPRASIAAWMGEAELIQEDYRDAREWLEAGEFSPETRMHGFWMLALLEIAEGDRDAALAAFDRALEGGEGTAALWIDIARLHYMSGRHFEALEAAQTALERDASDPRALEFKALLVRDSEGLEASLEWFERGLGEAPDDLSLLAEYASTLGELGRGGEMLEITRRMIELDPRNPRAFYLQAVLAARAGKNSLARRLLGRTGNALDGIPALLMLEGILEMRAGNSALAVEAFASLTRVQPDNPRAAELFARALLENGEAREVVVRFAEQAGRQDASAYLMTLVGRAYEELGDREKAAPFLDRAAQAAMGLTLTSLANSERADLLLFRFGNDPARLDTGIARIRKLVGEGDYAGAAKAAADLRELYAGSADFLTIAGDVALAGGDFEAALADYREAARIRRPFRLVAKMAAALQQAGRLGEAREVALAYLAQHPMDRDAAWLAALLVREAGDWRQVRALALHIRGLAPATRDPRLLALLAEAQLETGEAGAALENATSAWRMQPLNGYSAGVLARAMRQTGGEETVIASLEAKARQAGGL